MAIGDSGFNKITTSLDLPRIHQIYRFLSSPSDYAPAVSDFGFAFMNDFELYPNPYRHLDSQASIIDQLVSFDDASDESNVVRDMVGISGGIATTNESYCFYPMFRVTPGFISKVNCINIPMRPPSPFCTPTIDVPLFCT